MIESRRMRALRIHNHVLNSLRAVLPVPEPVIRHPGGLHDPVNQRVGVEAQELLRAGIVIGGYRCGLLRNGSRGCEEHCEQQGIFPGRISQHSGLDSVRDSATCRVKCRNQHQLRVSAWYDSEPEKESCCFKPPTYSLPPASCE